MAMEKAAKAYLMARGADPMALQSSHAYIAKNIPAIVRQELTTDGARPRWVMRAVQAFARRIELLHPQVDDGGALPANCEYPWQNAAGDVVAPADHNFELDVLTERVGVLMIKAVWASAAAVAEDPR